MIEWELLEILSVIENYEKNLQIKSYPSNYSHHYSKKPPPKINEEQKLTVNSNLNSN